MSNNDKLMNILLDINPDIDYETADSLVSSGEFDSLEVMSVVMEIEEVFHIEIDPEDIVAENFNSFGNILALIAKSKKDLTE